MSRIRAIDADTKFPWRSVFRLAMTQGMSPEQAWRMTPGEILACLPAAGNGEAEAQAKEMTPTRLAALMARYPDAEAVTDAGRNEASRPQYKRTVHDR